MTPPPTWPSHPQPAPKRKRPFAALQPVVILVVVLFVLGNMVSQCSSSSTDSGSSTPGLSQSSASQSDSEQFALDNLGYETAASIDASDAVSGLAEAPDPIRKFVASYAADPVNSEMEWLAVTDTDNGAGYLILKPTDTDFETQLAIIHQPSGKYALTGPLAAGIPGQ
jgi:hypothetical protein